MKAKTIENVFEWFPLYSRLVFDAHWKDQLINEMCDTYLNKIEDAVVKRDNFDDQHYMVELMMLLGQPLSGPRKPIINLFTGSLFQTLIAVEYLVRRLHDVESVRKFETVFKEEFSSLIVEVRVVVKEAIGNLTMRSESGDRDALATLGPAANSALHNLF